MGRCLGIGEVEGIVEEGAKRRDSAFFVAVDGREGEEEAG
jgi:hypothetical protein